MSTTSHRYTRTRRISGLIAIATIAAMLLNLAPGIVPGTRAPEASAHNLQTRMVSMFLDPASQALLDARMAAPGWAPPDPLLQAGDEVGLMIKVIPRDGTTTGVGGHVDFYVPSGVDVIDVGYMIPDGSGGFVKTAMKGQSPIAVGDGPIGAKATSQLVDPTGWNGYTNVNGVTEKPVVPASGLHRGTIAGVYGDTGIFYSTDPDTAYGSWQAFTGDSTANGCGSLAYHPTVLGKTLVNNSGDTVVPCNKWDAEQLMAWGVKGGTYGVSAPIVDYGDGRGNAPWGFAAGTGGPESGYKWNFDWDEWQASPKTAADMRNAMGNDEVGPWNRIKYPGSRVSYDQPGLVSSVLGYASLDASNLGYAVSSGTPLPSNTKAIRWAVGQLTSLRPEYVWVKLRLNSLVEITDPSGCPLFRGDTFGGDAGGTDNGKDHLWRYYEPTEVRWNGCLTAQKPATREFVKVGDTYQYKLKVYNLQNFTLSAVVVKDPIPSGVTFISALPAQNSGPSPLVWNVGTLLPGQKWEATVTVKVTGTGYIDNCMTVDATTTSGPFPTQTVCETTESGAIVFLVPTKSATPSSVAPGATVTYDILVKNIGTGPTGNPVTVKDFLPGGMVYDGSFTPVVHVNGAMVTPTVNTTDPANPVFTIPAAINGGAEMTIKFRAIVPANANPGTYCNSYSVTQNGVPITTGSEGCIQVGGGKIGDTIFRDWNGNGTQDAGEEGMPGVTVVLLDGVCTPGVNCRTAVTDVNGQYLFSGLTAGSYTVAVPAPGAGGVPTGYTLTADPDGAPYATTFTKVLATDEIYLGADWGYMPGGTGAIGDLVFDDKNDNALYDTGDTGIPGATVNLYEDSNGNGVVDAGDLLIKTTTTNANGNYSFTGLATGLSYIVDVLDSSITTYYGTNVWEANTADPQAVPNLAGTYNDADFGYYKILPGQIGDEVFQDNNGNGFYDSGDSYLPLITVKLYRDADGDGQPDPTELVGTTQTDATGHYLFDRLPPGNYLVIVDTADPELPAGTVPSKQQYNITLGSGQQILTADFAFVPLISKTADKTYASPGDTINFGVKVNYTGSQLLTGVKVVDPLPLGTTCGTVGQGGTCAAYSPTAGTPGTIAVDTTGVGVWSPNAVTPQYSPYDGSVFETTPSSAVALPAALRVMAGAGASGRDEKIVAGVTTAASNNVVGMRWNGAAWTALCPDTNLCNGVNYLGTASETFWWPAAVAYEQVSGDALLVWGDNPDLKYSVWNGTAWTVPAVIDTPYGGEHKVIRMASRPGSDEIVAVVSSVLGDYALVWSGSSWSGQGLYSAAQTDYSDVSVTFELQSRRALVAYGKNTGANVFYRTWDGTSWSTEASVAPPSGVTARPKWTTLGADPKSNRIALGVVTAVSGAGGGTWLNVWSGSAWGTSLLATATPADLVSPDVAVAFESTSGEALAAYGHTTDNFAYYRTWTSGGGWAAQTQGPALSNDANSLILSPDPNSDEIMLVVQDDANDLRYVPWTGSAWGTAYTATTDTNEVKNQPFLYLWDRHVGAQSTTTLAASPAAVAAGGAVTLVLTLQSTQNVFSVTPSQPTFHNGTGSCVGPAEPVPATVLAGTPKTFTFTCTPASLGEIWFTGGATSSGYSFAEGDSNTVLVSSDGSSSVVTWSLGSNTEAVPGVVSTGGVPNRIFALRGGNTTTFWAYETVANSWSTKTVVPAAVEEGGALVYDGSTYLYALRGNGQKSFYRSDTPHPGANTWSAMTSTPGNVNVGGALTYVGGATPYIYATQGKSTVFWRYAIGGNSWTAMTPALSTIGDGGALANDGTYIYALAGNKTTAFLRYDISGNSWLARASTPAAVGRGGALVRLGSYLYALQGNTTTGFWRYDIAANTWTTRANTPATVLAGGSLTTDGTYIYAMGGNNTTNFWRYDPAANSWTARAATPLAVDGNGGGSLAFVQGTDSVSRLTEMSASPTLVGTGKTITVKQTLTAGTLVNNVTPSALTITNTGGASASCTGPVPASQNVPPNTPTTFTWTCPATAGATPGTLTFAAGATGDGPTTFATGTSNNVLVAPDFTFSAVVSNPINPPGLTLVHNTAILDDASDPAPRPDMCYIVADSKAGGVDDNDILVAWNQVSNSISDVGTGTGTTHAEAAAWNLEGTKLYTTNRDPSVGSGSDRLGTVDAGTGLYSALGRIVSTGNPLEGSLGSFAVLDVDGMSFDPLTGYLYAIHRREDSNLNNTLLDVLFRIDPATNFHVEDAFGAGIDYVVLQTNVLPGGSALYDVDDIAFHPSTGILYAIANDSTTGVGDKDRLITINKSSGALTDIGRITNAATGAGIDDMEGLAFQADGSLYGTTGTDTTTPNRLWKINLTTAVATLVQPFLAHADYEAIACLPGGATQVPIPPTPSNTTETALTATIGDYVWVDSDGMGDQDPTEVGLAGVKVYVDSNNNGVWDSGEPYDVTDGYGKYRIFGLTAGTYMVRTDPATYPPNYSPTTDQSLSVTLSAGTQYNNADFGLQPPGTGSIGDRVWLDANNDGVQDAGESGLASVAVKLYRDINGNGVYDPATDAYVATDTTDAAGNYLFTGLADAKYLVIVDTTSTIASPYGGTYTLAAATNPTYDEDNGTTNPNGISAVTLSGGAAHLTSDFGYNWGGTIGDYVWWDDNTNGTPDAGEDPIAGAAVLLYFDANGNGILDPAMGDYQVGFAMTDANGLYSFTNLPPGPYLVDVYEDSFNPEPGVRATVPTTPNVQYVSLGPKETVTTADFGYFVGAKVEGNVFWDEDRNGLFDGAEEGLYAPGSPPKTVTVTLTGYDMFGNPVNQTVETDENGHFAFVVPEGDYTLTYSTGDVLAIDPSLLDQTTPTSFTFHAYPGEDWHPSFDFGVDNSGLVGDLVWNDANGNGLRDTGEPGISGVTVELYSGATLLGVTVTDANGLYQFAGLPDGTYTVKVNPATLPWPSGYTQTYDNLAPVTDHTGRGIVSGGGQDLSADFGYKPPSTTYPVSGTIWDDLDKDGVIDGGESRLAGVAVCLYLSDGVTLVACTTTDTNGLYGFPGMPNGSYLISVGEGTLPSAAYVETAEPQPIQVTDGLLTGTEYGTFNGIPVIGGKLDMNGDGFITSADDGILPLNVDQVLKNVLVIDGQLDVDGNGTITATDDALVRNALAPVTVSGAAVPNQNFGYTPSYGSISGTICEGSGNGDCTPGEPTLAGVPVFLTYDGPDGLFGTADDQVSVAITDGSGSYSFTNLPAGGYQVSKVNPAGYSSLADIDLGNLNNISDLSVTPGTTVADYYLNPGQTVVNRDFEVQRAPGQIGDTVWLDVDGDGVQDVGEPGLPNVTVELKDGAGNPIDSDPATPGVQPTYATTDQNGNYLFTGVPGNPAKAAIGDTVWHDADHDGLQDPGETGLPNVLVALWDAGPDGLVGGGDDTLVSTTVTDLDGSYLFANLAAGSYYVDVVSGIPAGLSPTTGTTDPSAVIALSQGEVYLHADFGYASTTKSALGDTVWHDVDGDGVHDPGEPGLGGVSITVTGPSCPSGCTVTTEPDGSWLVTNLNPGSYTVTVTPPAGFFGTPTNGPATQTFTVPANTDVLNADFGFDDDPGTGPNPTGTIGDTLYADVNGNGGQDTGEAGIGGVTLNLINDYDNDGLWDPDGADNMFGTTDDEPILASTATNAAGFYQFAGLPDGNYLVQVSDVHNALGGLTLTGDPDEDGIPCVTCDALGDAAVSGGIGPSDVDFGYDGYTYTVDVVSGIPASLTASPGTTDPTTAFSLVSGESKLDVDLGYTTASPTTAIIGDWVWSDDDNDGIQDPGEPGIAGVTVILKLTDGTAVATTTTGPDGTYHFTNVAPGEYIVDVLGPAGYTLTTGPQSNPDPSLPISVAAGDIYLNADFGFRNQGLASIQDTVWYDTDRDGVKDPGEAGIPGVTVNLVDNLGNVIATDVTAPDGTFSFDGVPNGFYTVVITDNTGQLTGLQSTTPEATAALLPVTVTGANVTGVHFGYAGLGPIGDTVFSDHNANGQQDPGEPGIANVQVKLYYDDGDGVFEPGTQDVLISTQVTGGSGEYLFNDLPFGTFWVSVDDNQAALSGYMPTTLDQDPATPTTTEYMVPLSATSPSYLDADYGYQRIPLADVSGTVWNDTDADGTKEIPPEAGLAGVTVLLVDPDGDVVATTTTDPNGNYTFFDVAPGNYTVVVPDVNPVLDGYWLTSGLDEIPVTVGTSNLTGIDFGYVNDPGTGAIGDRVWHDADMDGVQDAAEGGLPNVTVRLYDVGPDGVVGTGDDVLRGTSVTDMSGNYLFPGLPAGNYYVDVVSGIPSGLSPTSGSTDPSGVIALSAGEEYLDADFGYASTALYAIGDLVWYDADADGLQDSGEIGIGGVTVRVYDNTNTLVGTAVTDPDGSWLVTGLNQGATYRVVVDTATLPSGYNTTPTNYGGLPADQKFLVPVPGADVLYADFGFDGGTPATIGDTVYYDTNGNGTQDPGEPGIPGVTVNLLDNSGKVVGTATTDPNGQYQFSGVPDGSYTVDVTDVGNVLGGINPSDDPDGGTPDGLTTVTVSGGQVSAIGGVPCTGCGNSVDFGYAPEAGSIGNLVWHDLDGDGIRDAGEPGIEGITLNLWVDVDGDGGITPGVDNLLRTTSTDANGLYEFTGLVPEQYLVDVTDTLGVLGGFVGTRGVPGVDNNSQTDPYAVTLTATAPSNYTADFGFKALTPHTISGTAFDDANNNGDTVPTQEPGEAGVPAVTVLLYRDLDGDGVIDPEDPLIGTTLTDANGDYTFTDVPDGDYVVAVDATGTDVDGWYQTTQEGTPQPAAQPVQVSGASEPDIDFGFWIPKPGIASVGDRVWLDEDGDGVQDAGEGGIANVTVKLYDSTGTALLATTVTDSDGGYLFGGLQPGTYVVKVDTATLPAGLAANQTGDPDATLDDQAAAAVAAGQELTTIDFGYNWVPSSHSSNPPTGATGAIGDRLWIDADGNGVQDPGEAGLPGIPVALRYDSNNDGLIDAQYGATVNTGPDGSYIFDGLPAGIYQVVVNGGTTPAGYTLTGDPDGTPDNKTTSPIVLAPGDVFLNADFGYDPTAGSAIGDLVYLDLDGDGLWDTGEPGIPGVTVALLDGAGKVIATTTTDPSGQYLFDGIPAGTYTVWVNDVDHVLGEVVQTGDPDATLDNRHTLAVDGSSAYLGNDFGYAPPDHNPGEGLIGDLIFLDADGDGTFDAGEPGLEGVTVKLYDAAGTTLLATTVTDENGHYTFGGLNATGTYTVKVDTTTLQAGMANSVDPDGLPADSMSVRNLGTLGAIDLAADFGYKAGTPNSISGTIWDDADADGTLDAGEPGVQGVTVALYDPHGHLVATATTDASGNYSFPGLPAGTYTVDVTDEANVLDGRWHSDGPNDGMDNNSQPDPYTVTVSGGTSNVTADFGYFDVPASLGNWVWRDAGGPGSTGNGIQESGEVGIAGAKVSLYITYANGTLSRLTTTTDANGYYRFDNLLLDESFGSGVGEPTYVLRVDLSGLPGVFLNSPENATSEDKDSDNPFGEPVDAPEALTRAFFQDKYDFGFYEKPTNVVLLSFTATWEGETVGVEWETAAELENLGFNLFRSVSYGGVRTQLNADLIPSAVPPGSGQGHAYTWVDDTAIQGQNYYYWLESVSIYGPTEIFGPASTGGFRIYLPMGLRNR